MGQGGGFSKFTFSCDVRVTGGSPCPTCGNGPEAPDEACAACMTRKRRGDARSEHVQSEPAPEGWPEELGWVSPCARCGVPTDTTGESVSVLDQCIRFAPSLAWDGTGAEVSGMGASVACGQWWFACVRLPDTPPDPLLHGASFGRLAVGVVDGVIRATVEEALSGLAERILECEIEDSAELRAAAEVLAEAGRRHAGGIG